MILCGCHESKRERFLDTLFSRALPGNVAKRSNSWSVIRVWQSRQRLYMTSQFPYSVSRALSAIGYTTIFQRHLPAIVLFIRDSFFLVQSLLLLIFQGLLTKSPVRRIWLLVGLQIDRTSSLQTAQATGSFLTGYVVGRSYFLRSN